MATRFIDQDRATVKFADKKITPVTLFWGDPVEVVGPAPGGGTEILIPLRGAGEPRPGVLPKGTKLRDDSVVLKVRFVDVGQGDGAILESPAGKLVLVDGGEEDNFRRYVKIAFGRAIARAPLECHTVIATHGDADHYEGLVGLMRRDRKREKHAPVRVGRFLHNGLVKRVVPDGLKGEAKELAKFGAIVKDGGGAPYCAELVDDLAAGSAEGWSPSFKRLRAALEEQRAANPGLVIERLEYGREAFPDFAAEGVKIEVLGPIVEEVGGKPALRFLGGPGGGLSASHTVNGHSVVLKVTYGNVRFLFGADLNEASEERLLARAKADGISLQAEVLKVPHHGSHEFRTELLEAIEPVVSVVSSGDENVAKDFIHPRAGLMGALGKFSRKSVAKPLVFVTEMVAFFNQVNNLSVEREGGAPEELDLAKLRTKKSDGELAPVRNLYAKTQFGIVHARTDGKKLLVITHSGKATGKEFYTFQVGENGKIQSSEVEKVPDDGE